MNVDMISTFQCAGGTHIRLSGTVGAVTHEITVDSELVRQPLTVEQRLVLIEYLARTHVTGMTGAQARSALLAGWSVTL